MVSQLAQRLLDWYAAHARDLSWRGHVDAYAVWVREVMLQQTRVETVGPYFERWMARFPTIAALAAASEEEVLALWEGLGYYSRARNLHRAAREVVVRYGGALPRDLEALRALPGVGAYTAGAIASFAFGLDEPVVDGNVRRVFSRLFDLTAPVGSTALERRLWALAREHLPPGRAADFNQALMDFGATVCTPRTPRCEACPLADLCRARALGVVDERPVRRRKAVTPHYRVVAGVIQRDGEVLIARRPSNGLLGGLWEFPGGKVEPGEALPEALRRELWEELRVRVQVGEPVGVYRHAYSHFRVTLYAFRCCIKEGRLQPLEHSDIAWVSPRHLSEYPMGKIDRQIARELGDEGERDEG